jgi:hypothetical protein
MTECELVRARFEPLLHGELPIDEQRQVTKHLLWECQGCATWLSAVDLASLVEVQAIVLSDLERQRMLSAALAEAPRRRRAWLAPGLAVAAAAAVVLFVARPIPRDGWTGEKTAGAAPIAFEVRPIVGSLDAGRPRVLRDWAAGEPLARGELLLFRLDVDRPAYVYLVGNDGRILYAPEASAGPLAAGDHELTEDGQALALDPATLPAPARLLWVAAPERVPPQALAAFQRAHPEGRQALCPSCAAVELSVDVRAP